MIVLDGLTKSRHFEAKLIVDVSQKDSFTSRAICVCVFS